MIDTLQAYDTLHIFNNVHVFDTTQVLNSIHVVDTITYKNIILTLPKPDNGKDFLDWLIPLLSAFIVAFIAARVAIAQVKLNNKTAAMYKRHDELRGAVSQFISDLQLVIFNHNKVQFLSNFVGRDQAHRTMSNEANNNLQNAISRLLSTQNLLLMYLDDQNEGVIIENIRISATEARNGGDIDTEKINNLIGDIRNSVKKLISNEIEENISKKNTIFKEKKNNDNQL